MPLSTEQFWVDDFGYLWRGPLSPSGPGKKYTWQRFNGVRKGGKQIWEWNDPVTGLVMLPEARARRMIARFVIEDG